MTQTREYDEKLSLTRAEQLLASLQIGMQPKHELIAMNHRFSAAVDVLRQQGYVIESFVSEGVEFYRLVGRQCEMVRVTRAMQDAYYTTPHWHAIRQRRLNFDGRQCVLCQTTFTLAVHHWRYDLFAENLHDLSTLCDHCHQRIHANRPSWLHFPRYVTPEMAERLLSFCVNGPVAA